ncbi:MAG: hypothetical protein MK357_05150 [SAR202 cluster bacterium]|nr:hypothetical protein [SAR202 cluster bacterium]
MWWLIVLSIFVVLVVILTYFIRYIRGEQALSVESLLWVYFRTFALIGLLICVVGGISNILQAGFAATIGPEFSWSSHREFNEGITSRVFDGSITSSLVTGITLFTVGLIIWVSHYWGTLKLAGVAEEVTEHFKGLFTLLALVVFSLVSLTSLTTSLPSLTEYFIDEPSSTVVITDDSTYELADTEVLPKPEIYSDDYRESPGDSLSIFLTSLPVWIWSVRKSFMIIKSKPTVEE